MNGYLIVVENDPDADMSWLEQSIYDPESPDYEPTYPTEEDMRADTNAYDPEDYRNPDNHDAASITVCPLGEDGAVPEDIYRDGASVWGVDYFPSGEVAWGRWCVVGPNDLPSMFDAYTCDMVRQQFAELGVTV